MAHKMFPFDSVKGDRVYKSEDFANYFSGFITDGLIHNNGQVGFNLTGINNMGVTVSEGGAFIRGRQFLSDEPTQLIFEKPVNAYRRDMIILKLDLRTAKRSITLEIKQGIESYTKENLKDPILDDDTYIKEIGLYTVDLDYTSNVISQNSVKDVRGKYCTLANLTQFGGASIFVGEEEPDERFVKKYDIWLDY